MTYLQHHGIDGQKWGRRNGPPYPLDYSDYSAAEKKKNKKDARWIKNKTAKITKKAYKKSQKELTKYASSISNKYALNANGKVSSAYINDFNRKTAQIMSEKVSDIKSPSGRVVKFVAKRGEIGVYMALADPGYDMSNVKNGVWDSGRVAYKKQTLDRM